MNKYSRDLSAALGELEVWRSLPGDCRVSEETYDYIETAIRRAIDLPEEALLKHLSNANRFIADQGPYSPDFIPTFKRVFLAVHAEGKAQPGVYGLLPQGQVKRTSDQGE